MKTIELKENDIIKLFGKRLKVVSANADDFDCEKCSLCPKCEIFDVDDVLCSGLFDDKKDEKILFFKELESDYEKDREIANNNCTHICLEDCSMRWKDKQLVAEIYAHLDGINKDVQRMTSGNYMHNTGSIRLSVSIIKKRLEELGIKEIKL